MSDTKLEPLGPLEPPTLKTPEAPAGRDYRPSSKPQAPGSLRDRMRRRREELERRTTEIFPVPRYGNFVAVELRTISWAKTEEFIEQGQRVPDTTLRVAGEEIVAATLGFFEVQDDGSLEQVTDGEGQPLTSWNRLACDLAGATIPEGVPERVGLLALCTDQGAIALNTDFRRWLAGENTGLSAVASEIRRDF